MHASDVRLPKLAVVLIVHSLGVGAATLMPLLLRSHAQWRRLKESWALRWLHAQAEIHPAEIYRSA